MLMSEQQIRLNEVRLKIKETLDFIRFLQENHPDRPLAHALDEHIPFFREQLTALKEEVRQLGALPREPDPEHELVEQMLAELKSLFGEDKDLVLLQEFNKHRNDIVDTIQYALEVDYPGNIRHTLQRVSRYSRSIRA
ncbi:MAG TPA: hypothetical protein VKZ88_04865 [Fibrobacteria bacterium]|nr:hypothetical protein [Fibrobacteria bacterium]